MPLFQIIASLFLLSLITGRVLNGHLIDFKAFYGAGEKILTSLSPYGQYETYYGFSVFQSFPWLAWIFSPLALLPIDKAWHVFLVLNFVLLFSLIIIIAKNEGMTLSPINLIFYLSCSLTISSYCFSFGQVTLLQLFILVIMIIQIKKGEMKIAGAFVPFVLIKPHLVLWFLILAFWTGDRRFIRSSVFFTILIASIALVLQPTWPIEMARTIVTGQAATPMENWKFMTLPGLFSLPPLYGYLVLPISLPFLFALQRQFKMFSVSTQLYIGLAFSLLTSPYAFAYDLPLLIPALLWLTMKWPAGMMWIWILLATIPTFAGFSGVSYFAVIIVCILLIVGIFLQKRLNNTVEKS